LERGDRRRQGSLYADLGLLVFQILLEDMRKAEGVRLKIFILVGDGGVVMQVLVGLNGAP
jgi:hypothetical protein